MSLPDSVLVNDLRSRARLRLDEPETLTQWGDVHYYSMAAQRILELSGTVGSQGKLLDAAKAEIERLRAGGCARDQKATQYCAQAEELSRELERVKVALANALSERDHARAMLECARNG